MQSRLMFWNYSTAQSQYIWYICTFYVVYNIHIYYSKIIWPRKPSQYAALSLILRLRLSVYCCMAYSESKVWEAKRF